MNSDRVVALAGLAICASRGGRTSGLAMPQELCDCARSIQHTIPKSFREPRSWTTLGLAQHVLGGTNAARAFHLQALQQERRREGRSNAARSAGALVSIADVVDFTSASHSALHLGLVEFWAGDEGLGAAYVEQLILCMDTNSSEEVSEWLVRFTRAHAWAPAGYKFGAYLLERSASLLTSLGDDRLARHLVEYGRFLFRMDPPQGSHALTQLQRAEGILKR